MKVLDTTEIETCLPKRIGLVLLGRGQLKVLEIGDSPLPAVTKFVDDNIARYQDGTVFLGIYAMEGAEATKDSAQFPHAPKEPHTTTLADKLKKFHEDLVTDPKADPAPQDDEDVLS